MVFLNFNNCDKFTDVKRDRPLRDHTLIIKQRLLLEQKIALVGFVLRLGSLI